MNSNDRKTLLEFITTLETYKIKQHMPSTLEFNLILIYLRWLFELELRIAGDWESIKHLEERKQNE